MRPPRSAIGILVTAALAVGLTQPTALATGPLPSQAQSRAQSQAQSQVRQAAGPAAPSVSRPAERARSPWVTGYYAGWFWDQMYPPQAVDMGAMTHFVFGRVAPGGGSVGGEPGEVVEAAGTAHEPGLAPGGRLSVEDYLVRKAHRKGRTALLMLGGDGLDGRGFVASTAPGVREQFVENVVDYLVAHRYDGVDVDWENCLSGEQGCGADAAEARTRLLRLLRELRAEAATRARFQQRDLVLTYPGGAVNTNFLGDDGAVEPWQAEVASLVDQYNLMTYGVGTTWNGDGWRSWFSGALRGASPSTPVDIASSIKAYVKAGVPRRRLGIGLGFFGVYYGPSVTGPRQSTEGNDVFETNDVALAYSELRRKGYLSHGRARWDDRAQASYRSYRGGYVPASDPGANPAGFLSYESPRSIAAKARWVRRTGLGGTIIWTVNYGYLPSGRNPLLDAVQRGFLR